MNVERKLAAVMFTDIVGFTKIMTDSEDTGISILKAQDDIVDNGKEEEYNPEEQKPKKSFAGFKFS